MDRGAISDNSFSADPQHNQMRGMQTRQVASDGKNHMESVELIRRLHQHRQWVNYELLAAADQLSDEQLHRSFEIGRGSIWKTLTHLYAAEYIWLEALSGNKNPLTPGDVRGKLPGNQEGETLAYAFSSCTNAFLPGNQKNQRVSEAVPQE